MNLADLFANKDLKSKAKTEKVSSWLLDNTIDADELTAFAKEAKDPVKATCIEALEYATQKNPAITTVKAFQFVTQSLAAKAPRVKWESARVIGNTAHLFTDELENAIKILLINSEDEGTVVRWSAAFALGEILKLKTKHNDLLLDAIEAIINHEEKNSIKKIYLDALKKLRK
jgi:HEAT repeat protein